MSRLATLLLVLCLGSGAAAFLVSNTRVGSRFVPERVPSSRRPVNVLVDSESVPGVASPVAVAQDLMNQWNAVNEAEAVFGTAAPGGPFNGATVGETFGVFTDSTPDVAWDDTGEILSHFGLGGNVLGITLKSVDTGRGDILDFLIVINTRPGFLIAPGSGATAEELFRATLLHELGHALGLGHSPVGMANPTTFGLALAAPQQVPTMFPFRLPQLPQEGGTINGDDVAGLISIYPVDTAGLGSISGSVRGASGAPVDEIAVRAVGPAGVGEEHVGILTNVDGSGQGRFTIPNLPPGPYRVVVEAVNGRASVTGLSLAGGADALGANPFVFAEDELWQPGDTWRRSADDPAAFAFVYVRAGRDTGSVDFVLNAQSITDNQTIGASLANGDARLPDAVGGFHFVDYYLFSGDAGQDVTIFSLALGTVTPQLQILRPSDLGIEAQDLPQSGAQAVVNLTLSETGLYTIALGARATTGNPGGQGAYQITVAGAGGPLPPPPTLTGATVERGPGDPGAREFASPVCDGTLLQLRLTAPSHEELWVDTVTVRASGSGHDATDVGTVRVVLDRNGDGQVGRGEPVLASGSFLADDGTAQLTGLEIELDPGQTADLLVVYDVTVGSVSSTAGSPAWWLAPLALSLLLLRRRSIALLLLFALMPLSCGGGGGGCNGAFDPEGAIVTFAATVEAGGVTAFTPTSDPGTPLALPASAIRSGTLSVSN